MSRFKGKATEVVNSQNKDTVRDTETKVITKTTTVVQNITGPESSNIKSTHDDVAQAK
jgi:hypothetical protein